MQSRMTVLTLQNDVTLLNSFQSNPTSTTPQQAAEAALRVTRAAAEATAPKSAVTLAQSALTSLSKTPCVPAIPHLLSICENDPFQALDVFVLSSAAWKALVAAAITAPPAPHLAMRIISCAALNATAVITKCLQPSTHSATEIIRTIKIAKFYCLNAARCSRAFHDSIQHPHPNLLSEPFLHLFDFLALSSFVLLFDQHAILPAHEELNTEVLPLVTNTVKTLLAMIHHFSQEQVEQAVRPALESTGKHHIFADLSLPTAVLQLLAVLNITRCALDTKQQLNKVQSSEQPNLRIVTSLLVPFLFHCVDVTYEEVVLFREKDSAQTFLDTVTSATADLISTAQLAIEHAGQRQQGLDFLFEQVASDNAVRSNIAQEALLHMATSQNADDGWRDFITATVLACLRKSLNLCCEEVNPWQELAVRLCLLYVQERKHLTKTLATSQRLCNTPTSSKGNALAEPSDDPISIVLLAQLCDFISSYENDLTSQDAITQSQKRNQARARTLETFQLDASKVAKQAQDLALASTGYRAMNAISLLPYVLDSKSACGTAISVLQRESIGPSIVCAALNILDPSIMEPAAVDTACIAATSAVSRYGAVVCPAISAFISKAAYFVGATVSVVHWQRLSTLLESCLITSQEVAEPSPPTSHALTGGVLHYAAVVALSLISNSTCDERHTRVSIPVSIASDVEAGVKLLEKWRAGEHGLNLQDERSLVHEERYSSETLWDSDGTDRMDILYNIREARERLLQVALLLLDQSDRGCISEEVSEELSFLQNSIRTTARYYHSY